MMQRERGLQHCCIIIEDVLEYTIHSLVSKEASAVLVLHQLYEDDVDGEAYQV